MPYQDTHFFEEILLFFRGVSQHILSPIDKAALTRAWSTEEQWFVLRKNAQIWS